LEPQSTDSPALKEAVAIYRQSAISIPRPVYVRSLTDGNGQDEPIYVRGNPHAMSKKSNPRHFLDAVDSRPFRSDGSGRREWAEALVSDSNPLVPRVEVNRIWYRIFGQGLVSTIDNFGQMGSPPSHPKLLDHLASDFKSGWSRKDLIRRLVLSNTYRMSSRPSSRAQQVDPENVLLQHMPLRRLSAEAIRDSILAASGELKHQMYGQGVPVNLDQSQPSRSRPFVDGPLDGDARRTVYLEMRRNYLPGLLIAFDLPKAAVTVGQRGVTNVPAQSLALLNDPFVLAQAETWAENLLERGGQSVRSRIQQVHLAAFSRAASEQEIQQSKSMLLDLAATYNVTPDRAKDDQRLWKDFCHMMINRKEFIFYQ
ncbi:MAG: DUF1553 domain-containing protein, partial [Planctomycetales bacterium]